MRPPREAALCLVLAGSPLLAAEVFLSPQIETAVGCDSNRYQTDEDDGASLASVMPSLDVTCFLTETVELTAGGSYMRREFLREGFSHQEQAGGSMGLWRAGPALEGGVLLAASRTRDEAIPEDDMMRWGATLSCAYNDLARRRYACSGSIEHVTYDEVKNHGGDELTGTYWTLRPSVGMPIGSGASAWGAPLLERFSCEDATRDYTGYGIGLGVDYAPPSPWRAGAILQGGVRHADGDDSLAESNASVFSLTTWGAVRISPRTELFSDLQGGTFWSDDAVGDYRRWQWRVGVRLRHDAEAGSLLR